MKKLIIKTNDKELKNEAKLLGLTLYEEAGKLEKFKIKSKEDEQNIVNTAGERVLIEFTGQKIIPLENLVAELKGKTELLVKVKNADEAKLAMEALELGADGVVLETNDITELKKTMELITANKEYKLTEAKVQKIKPLGMGVRACIDTCDMMDEGEGMLVGSSSQGMILVQAEVEKNPFVSPRPFRVNAGAVSMYTLTGKKTRYLEEISSGDEVLVVNRKGITRNSIVGRAKLEVRPLVLVEVSNNSGKQTAKAILQNAETIRVVTSEGSKPVTKLSEGDKILTRFEKGGRHFGTLVKDEKLIEK
ncbi:MAG: 3-dehydroquinate synthase II [Candidatus Nanoarchaeia archaeon]